VLKVTAILLLAVVPLLAAPSARAVPPPRVGLFIWHESPNDRRALLGVRQGFLLAGLDAAFLEYDAKSDASAAREVLERWDAGDVDLVYAFGTAAALLARDHVRSRPVVFTAVTNPVGSGLVPDWDGSGTNLCGNSNWIAVADVLDVFRSTVPDLARLGVVFNRENPVPIEEVAEARRFFAARPEKMLKLFEESIHSPADLPAAVTRALDRGAQALWVPIDIDVYSHLDSVTEVTRPRRIPVVTSQVTAVRDGALSGVAVDYRSLGLASVVLAMKILREGASPATLPVGRMRAYRVLLNLAEARRIGFEIPLPILATADEIHDEEAR
jgi:putative ABC transport system substrate-binding protein